jgi:hypothetical protein
MAVFMVGYDLHEGENYEDLIKAIEKLTHSAWHCLDSTWLIVHDGPSGAIRDALLPHIMEGDRLLVAHVSKGVAWRGFNKQCEDWLRANL